MRRRVSGADREHHDGCDILLSDSLSFAIDWRVRHKGERGVLSAVPMLKTKAITFRLGYPPRRHQRDHRQRDPQRTMTPHLLVGSGNLVLIIAKNNYSKQDK